MKNAMNEFANIPSIGPTTGIISKIALLMKPMIPRMKPIQKNLEKTILHFPPTKFLLLFRAWIPLNPSATRTIGEKANQTPDIIAQANAPIIRNRVRIPPKELPRNIKLKIRSIRYPPPITSPSKNPIHIKECIFLKLLTRRSFTLNLLSASLAILRIMRDGQDWKIIEITTNNIANNPITNVLRATPPKIKRPTVPVINTLMIINVITNIIMPAMKNSPILALITAKVSLNNSPIFLGSIDMWTASGAWTGALC